MRRKAFTLVELLVVIGIIAVLIGILLPALNAARRQAGAVKCASALREMGNTLLLYENDNKGYVPPIKLNAQGATNGQYFINDYLFGVGRAYYFNFLAKYVTKTHLGYSGTNTSDASQAQSTVFWGCPSWSGYIINNNALNPNGVYVSQNGYGWNGFAEYTNSFPDNNLELGEPNDPPTSATDISNRVSHPEPKASPAPSGPQDWTNYWFKWYKFRDYHNPAEHAISGDCTFYVLESRPPNTDNSNTIYGQGIQKNALWVGTHGANQTTFDMYRHGKYPPIDGTNPSCYTADGGKVAFNILYMDGHVVGETSRDVAYKSVRMRFPG